MTSEQLLHLAEEALREFRELPFEEQARLMIDSGIIDENGRVLRGSNGEPDEPEESAKPLDAAK